MGLSSPRRRTFSILERGEAIATSKVVSSLLRNITINLWGLGATIIGLQVSVQYGTKCHGKRPWSVLLLRNITINLWAWAPPSSACR